MTPEAAALEHVRRMVTLAHRRLELGQSHDAIIALGPSLPTPALLAARSALQAAHAAFRAALETQSLTDIQTAEFMLGAAVDELDAIILRAAAGASRTLH